MIHLLRVLNDLQEALDDLSIAGDETVGQALERSPADNSVHRIMARMWICNACRGTGTLRELTLCFGADEDVECPHCRALDTVVMLEGAEGPLQ